MSFILLLAVILRSPGGGAVLPAVKTLKKSAPQATVEEQRRLELSLERYAEAKQTKDPALAAAELADVRSQLLKLAKRGVELKMEVLSTDDRTFANKLDELARYKSTADMEGSTGFQKFLHACYILTVCFLNPASTISDAPDPLPKRPKIENHSGANATQ